MSRQQEKHWSKIEFLHETVKNPNIHIKGTKSYYSNAWSGNFEESVVRYLYGDEYSLKNWEPKWKIDQLYIGNYVCIAAEAVILMGGNHHHRVDWLSLYPFPESYTQSYQGKGDTIIADGVWIGMRAMIMPGIKIGEGAIIGANAVVSKDVLPYSIIAGNPAKEIKKRFDEKTIETLLQLQIYSWNDNKFETLKSYLCANDIDALQQASIKYDEAQKNPSPQ
jgi:chloramphenicol O-acetyltransferase type B